MPHHGSGVLLSRLRGRNASELIEEIEEERQVPRRDRVVFGKPAQSRRACHQGAARTCGYRASANPCRTLCPEARLVDEERLVLHTVSGDHEHLRVVDRLAR